MDVAVAVMLDRRFRRLVEVAQRALRDVDGIVVEPRLRRAGVPVVPDLLVRRRSTPSQGGLGRKGRAQNVKGAFRLRRGARERVKGKQVVLVDDVLTTGATLAECTRVLLQAGAARVEVLTVARVVKT